MKEETATDPLPPFIPTVEAKAECADRQQVGFTANCCLEVVYPVPVPTVLTKGSLSTMKGRVEPSQNPFGPEEVLTMYPE